MAHSSDSANAPTLALLDFSEWAAIEAAAASRAPSAAISVEMSVAAELV